MRASMQSPQSGGTAANYLGLLLHHRAVFKIVGGPHDKDLDASFHSADLGGLAPIAESPANGKPQ